MPGKTDWKIYWIFNCITIAAFITSVQSSCDGKYIGKHFVTNDALTYKEAKQCCYKLKMEIFRVTNQKDAMNFQDVIANGAKAQKTKRFSFWIKRDLSKALVTRDLKLTHKCPMIQWSILGDPTPWTTEGFCGLQYRALCVPMSLKKYKNIHQGQLTYGKKRRRRDTPSKYLYDDDVCHLSATLNGYYVSGEKLPFDAARACCASKKLQLVSANLSHAEAAHLRHSLCYNFREAVQHVWVESNGSTPKTGCSSISLEDGEYLRVRPSTCNLELPVLCKNPAYDINACNSINYKELEGGVYLFSSQKVTFSQASICCRARNMNLVSLYSHKEASAMYRIMIQNGLNTDLNFWTSGTRKFNRTTFAWNDGKGIALNDYTEFCIAALEKLNMKSFMITDYGCERLLNFLCIERELSTEFSKSIAAKSNLKLTINIGNHSLEDPLNNLLSKRQAGLVKDSPPPASNNISDRRTTTSPRPSPIEVRLGKDNETVQLITDERMLYEDNSLDPDDFPFSDILSDEIAVDSNNTKRSAYSTCTQATSMTPIVSLRGPLSVDDAIKMSLLNRFHSLRKKPYSSINMGAASWKQKFINQLGRIFSDVCNDDNLFHKEFVNVMVGLNSIYQSSFRPGPSYDGRIWTELYHELENCRPQKLELKAHAYEVYAMIEKIAFTSPDKIKQLFPPKELSEKNSEIDPIIDSLWWMTTTTHAACYKHNPKNETNSLWATHFKAAMKKDFFEPLNHQWHHSGHHRSFFGPMIGDFNLERTLRNMRYCATAAYWQSKMIDRELFRTTHIKHPLTV